MGHGGYADHLPHLEDYTGLDIASDLVEGLQKLHPDRHYVCADATDPHLSSSLGGKTYDTVLCLNVLEHIENDKMAIQGMLSTLEKGGHLMLFVPAYQSLYSEMDRLAGHFKRYRRQDFSELLKGLPATVVESAYFNSLGGFGWWINKIHKPKTLNDNAVNTQLALFDKYLVPVAKGLDVFTRSFFGQSLVIIIRKD